MSCKYNEVILQDRTWKYFLVYKSPLEARSCCNIENPPKTQLKLQYIKTSFTDDLFTFFPSFGNFISLSCSLYMISRLNVCYELMGFHMIWNINDFRRDFPYCHSPLGCFMAVIPGTSVAWLHIDGLLDKKIPAPTQAHLTDDWSFKNQMAWKYLNNLL